MKITKKDKNRLEGSSRYFAGKIREEAKKLDDVEIYALGAIEELEADETVRECGMRYSKQGFESFKDLRKRVVEARDAYEKVLDEIADRCDDRAAYWKFYPVDKWEER